MNKRGYNDGGPGAGARPLEFWGRGQGEGALFVNSKIMLQDFQYKIIMSKNFKDSQNNSEIIILRFDL